MTHNPFERYTEQMAKKSNAEFILERERELGGRINMEDFRDRFGESVVEEDIRELQRIKDKISAEFYERYRDQPSKLKELAETDKKRGEAFEVLIIDQGELHGWFGDQTSLTRTSEYDDIKNGVDMVLEFRSEDGAEHIALAIDASMHGGLIELLKKLQRNRDKLIGERKVAEVKYYTSEPSEFKGKLDAVIPVVIGVDGSNADELMEDFTKVIKLRGMQHKTGEESGEFRMLIRKMDMRPVQIAFLQEIKTQLEFYQLQNINEDVFRKVERLLDIINGVMESKKDIKLGGLKHDKVFKIITGIKSSSS